MCIKCYEPANTETALNDFKELLRKKEFGQWNTTSLSHLLLTITDKYTSLEVYNVVVELIEEFYMWYLMIGDDYIPSNGIERFPNKVVLRDIINNAYTLSPFY
jgi:hypothetical protein